MSEENNKKGTTEKAEKAKKTLSEATEIIISLLGGHSDKAKEKAEKEKKKPKYVVTDTRTDINPLKKAEISEKQTKVEELKFTVEVLEDMESKDVSKTSKYSILIQDRNGAYITLDMLDLKTRILDYDFDLEDFLQEKLFKLTGNKSKETREVAVAIAEYLSRAMYYEECYVKTFTEVGWDRWNGKEIFKYDHIYTSKTLKPEILFGEYMTEEEIEAAPVHYTINSIIGKNVAANADDLISSVLVEDPKEKIDNINRAILEWCDNTAELMNYGENSAINSLLLGASMIGIVRQMLPYTKENNININIVGERASGKSTICHYLLSTFGNPAKLEGSFTDTINAVDKERVIRPVLPYILDERMLRTEDGSRKNEALKIIMDIFREYEGKVKKRIGGTKEDRKLSGKRTCGPIISSSVRSELEAIKNYEDIGQFRRFMEFSIKPEELFADKEMAERYERLASTVYGLGVEPFVEYIMILREMNSNAIEETYETLNKKISERLNATNVKGVESSSQRFALIILCYQLLREAILYKCTSSYCDNTEMTIKAFKKIVNDDSIIVNKSELIIEYLIENIVGKITQVNQKLEINLVNYIRANKDAFYIVQDVKNARTEGWKDESDTVKLDKTSYLGKIAEDDDTITIYYIGSLALEKLFFSPKIAEADKIKEYIKYAFDKRTAIEKSSALERLPHVDEEYIQRVLKSFEWITLKRKGDGNLSNVKFYEGINEQRPHIIIIDKKKYQEYLHKELNLEDEIKDLEDDEIPQTEEDKA